jgi:hypothetical protein
MAVTAARSRVSGQCRLARRNDWEQTTEPTEPVAASRFSGLAVAAFIVTFFFSLLGLILGIVAYARISRTGMRGKGLAVAAIVISAVFVIVQIILLSTGNLHFFVHTPA